MNSRFPGAVPEIPVRHLNDAAAYYESSLGFSGLSAEELCLAGISKETAGCFWRTQTFERDTATLAQC